MNNVSKSGKLALPDVLGFLGLCNKLFLGLCQLLLVGNQLSWIFFRLVLFANFLLDLVDLLIYLIAVELNWFTSLIEVLFTVMME